MAKNENIVEQDEKDLVEKREEITKYYEENIPHLKTQLEYESILRDIEKTRAERLQAQMFMAKSQAAPPVPQAAQAPKTGETPEKVASTPAKRTLKKAETND
tara:strand:+ start:79 stop:384 length:306 start_codon:yes stop_codon:yes gene_type:complete